MRGKHLRAMVATLLDHFHMTLDQVGDLTDWQIQHLYFHHRKEDGSIEPEPDLPPPDTLEGEMMRAELITRALRLPEEELVKIKEEIKARWQQKT